MNEKVVNALTVFILALLVVGAVWKCNADFQYKVIYQQKISQEIQEQLNMYDHEVDKKIEERIKCRLTQ
jgi:sensor domain CHASE-containing protein